MIGVPLDPLTVATVNALLIVHAHDGRATVRDVADVAGVSVSTAHQHLVDARELGLVTWTPGRAGTLRPAMRLVLASSLWPVAA